MDPSRFTGVHWFSRQCSEVNWSPVLFILFQVMHTSSHCASYQGQLEVIGYSCLFIWVFMWFSLLVNKLYIYSWIWKDVELVNTWAFKSNMCNLPHKLPYTQPYSQMRTHTLLQTLVLMPKCKHTHSRAHMHQLIVI